MTNLSEFHHSQEPPDKTKRIVTLIVIVVVLAGGAGYAFHAGVFDSHTAQTTKTYPRGL